MATTAPTAAPTAPAAPAAGGTGTPPATSPPAPTAAPVAPPAPPPDPNPVELQLFRYTKPDDSIIVLARVLDIKDLGMEDKTITFCSGRDGRTDQETDENGICDYPRTVTKTNEDQRLTALVSGISSPAVLHIPAQRVPKTQQQIDRDAKNNEIAKWCIRITVALWLIWAALILFNGFGEPLMNIHRTELTEQQRLLNNTPGVKDGPLEVKTDKATPFKERWQKPSLLILIALSVLTIGYSILSLREEMAEALRNGWSRIMDKRGHMAFTNDPALQRWLELVGLLKTARSRREIPAAIAEIPNTTTPETTPAPTTTPQRVHHKNTFWELLRSDLLSDFIMEVLPGLLRRIFA